MRLSLLPLILVLLFNGYIDWRIYKQTIKGRFSLDGCRVYWAISILLQLLIVLSVIFILSSAQLLSGATAIWVLFFYFLIYLPKGVYFLVSLLDYVPLFQKEKKHRYGTITGLVLSISLFGVMLFGAAYTRSHAQVKPVEIASHSLPLAFDNYRVVQLSDIHLENFGQDTSIIADVVAQVNALQPDAIMITGDVVNRKASELELYEAILSRLQAPDGVFSVLGNHDYGDYARWTEPSQKVENLNYLKEIQQKMGWTMLNNDHAIIRRQNDSLVVIGIENWGEPPFHRTGNLGKSYVGLNDGTFKILLSHSPVVWNELVLGKTNIDLVLSGHTHAGQTKLTVGKRQYSPSQWRYKEWGGLYERGNQRLYVNEGLGTVFLPMRMGAPPEITLVELRKR